MKGRPVVQEALPGLSYREACIAKARDAIAASQVRFAAREQARRMGLPDPEEK